MKNLIGIIIFFVIIFSCTTSQKTTVSKETVTTDNTSDTIRIVNDELEYELIIIELGFDSWLVTQKPMSYYSNNTLAFKNYRYVIEWNQRVTQPNRYNPNLYEQLIYYDQNIDYGIEVNYKLYQYFIFFQQKYKQRL